MFIENYGMILKCSFVGKDLSSTLNAIAYNSLTFPSHFIVSESLLNLIHGLLKKKPSERIDINSELFDKWFNDKK